MGATQAEEGGGRGRASFTDRPYAPPTCARAGYDRTGQTLAGYRVERLIGCGASCSVWDVRHLESGDEAVAKVHEVDVRTDELGRERFLREAVALSSVRHPNVVTLLEVGQTEGGDPFLIMERLSGEPLDERLAREPLSVTEAIAIARDLLVGLAAVHAAGVLHRDVKPENVFLAETSRENAVKLLDFGLARGLHWSSGKITRARAVGTPGYMSPEQARGRCDVDARADLYSVGVVVYEMLSGRRPFEGETAADVMIRACTEAPVPLSAHCPDLPASLTSAVMRAIACERADRWQTADAMRLALEAALA